MICSQLYIYTVLPQWGIFIGVVLLTVGIVEKKDIWTKSGWIVLIITGLTALFFNLAGELSAVLPDSEGAGIKSAGWQTVAGGALAAISLILFQLKKKRYTLLALLTIIYFILTFFLYSKVAWNSEKGNPSLPKTELKK